MAASPPSRPLIWIALLAWFAQLCLPPVHAAVMAQQEAGLAVWCGVKSPALEARLATLPHEVRDILEKGSAQAQQHADCLSFCASLVGPGALPSSPTPALRAAGLEVRVVFATPVRRDAPRLSPPVRGPPLNA